MNELTMSNFNGIWVIGRIETKQGAKYLKEPRMFLFTAQQHGVLNLPGNPEEVSLEKDNFHYPVNNLEIEALYSKQVSGVEIPGGNIPFPRPGSMLSHPLRAR